MTNTRSRQDTKGDISEEQDRQDVLEEVKETEEQECGTCFILFTENLLIIGIIYGSLSYAVMNSAFIDTI